MQNLSPAETELTQIVTNKVNTTQFSSAAKAYALATFFGKNGFKNKAN